MSERSLSVGFIGLGNIGMPMAANVLAAGFPLAVSDVRADLVDALAARGARVAGSLAALASASDIVEVCVRDDAQVRDVLLGSDGVFEGAGQGTIVAIHSTIRPDTVRELAGPAARCGATLLDAPITGGAAGAEARSLCYMVGGDAAALERCRPVFATSASSIVHAGELGAGAATKLCNNLVMYLGFEALHEAVKLAAAAGLDRDVLLQVTRANGVLTGPMEAFLGLRRHIDEHGLDSQLASLVEGFAGLADKDLSLALESARACGIDLPGAERCREQMRRVYGLDGG